MKKFIILSTIFLTACTNLSFDANEYDRLVSINILSLEIRSRCNSDISNYLTELDKLTYHQATYSTYRLNRDEIKNSSRELQSIVNRFKTSYKYSKQGQTFCEEKMLNIINISEIILNSIGSLK
jgi:hypothetical protein